MHKIHEKKDTNKGRTEIPHTWHLFFLFPTSVYIRSKRRNVGIENTTHLTSLRTEIFKDNKARENNNK